MASAASEAATASLRGDARAIEREPHDAATLAWVVAPMRGGRRRAILVLGPPLGDAALPSHSPYTFAATILGGLHPEPTEQGRYLIAICVPLLGAGRARCGAGAAGRPPNHAVAPIVVGTQLALVGVVVASIVAQYRFQFGPPLHAGPASDVQVHYFSAATLAVVSRSRRGSGRSALGGAVERSRRPAGGVARAAPRRQRARASS